MKIDPETPGRHHLELVHETLYQTFGKQAVLATDLYRQVYARDASYFTRYPMAVVRPQTPEQVQQLLAIASNLGVPVTFRAGGTSLSGQSVGEGIICDLRVAWKRAEVRDQGRKVWFEPGLTCAQVNQMLKRHGRKLGPDPASHTAAMMGGVLSNNSSGMHSGVRFNSYHTLSSMTFLLANGNRYDTAVPDDRERFLQQEQALAQGLSALRTRVLGDDALSARIRRKYAIKNVTGYGINALLDFEHPIDIFAHLLIGAEGTLGFIVSAELETLPLQSLYSSAMLYFNDATHAAAAVPSLTDSGAIAIELMDYASLHSLVGTDWALPELPTLPSGATALLIDYGADAQEQMRDITQKAAQGFGKLGGLLHSDPFSTTVAERERLWQIRDGIFPCVAGARLPGATVLLEDVAAPPDRLDQLVNGMQRLFGRHGYQGSIFGHARDGNMHPLVTHTMQSNAEVQAFGGFVEDMVELVLSLEGSLKGEHGTGRAIAPFVEREWGADAYDLMVRIKQLADPAGLLNPGVLINPDPRGHLEGIKQMPLLGDKATDTCIECGFCEHVCPSRYVSLTPRQRIQANRVLVQLEQQNETLMAAQVRHEYHYAGEQTCAVDGMCGTVCPMGISTGRVTDHLREQDASGLEKYLLGMAARHYGVVEDATREAIAGAVELSHTADKAVNWADHAARMLLPAFPEWSSHFAKPPRMPSRDEQTPDFVYYAPCVTRIFGGDVEGKDSLPDVVLRLADRAGLKILLPEGVHGTCCSQIWQHKGDRDGRIHMANLVVSRLWEWSQEGKIPIFCDTTSCTKTLLMELRDEDYGEGYAILTPENAQRHAQLKLLDITQWLRQHVLPKLRVVAPKQRVLLHPTCAAHHLQVVEDMRAVAQACAREVVLPDNWGCCGAGGDRSFMYPELADGALRDEREEVSAQPSCEGAYSLARTCEVVLSDRMPDVYRSLVYLVDEVTSPTENQTGAE